MRQKVGGYVALTKPRIIELLLVSTIPTMVVANRAIPSLTLMLATLIGGYLSAGGANALNMVYDRDIDAKMKRTMQRPLVTGVMSPAAATVFALLLEVLAFVVFVKWVNVTSAMLAAGAAAFYVFIYTMVLKRRSKQNIVIGGAAGAVPPMIGWAAVTGHVTMAAFLLFVVVFIWTPPHFWALAVRYRDDYAAANVPMLPVVASLRRTTLEILVYAVIMWAVTVLIGPAAHLSWIYAITATILGGMFTWYAARLYHHARSGTADVAEAMRLFSFSITYLTALFVVMAIDVLVLAH